MIMYWIRSVLSYEHDPSFVVDMQRARVIPRAHTCEYRVQVEVEARPGPERVVYCDQACGWIDVALSQKCFVGRVR